MTENFDHPIEIAEDTFWVSQRDPNTLLQVNTYLRRFRGPEKTINYLIDPGPLEMYPQISRQVGKVIQDIRHVQMYSVNHQDPDVGMNATFVSRLNPRSICLCTEDTWRLVRFFEIPKQTYKNVYSFADKQVSLASDPSHVIEFVPTPYCHFVGAMAVYDRSTGILFTGDLFGGLNPPGDLGLWATEAHWDGIKTFHQIYMPFNQPVRSAIDTIRRLTPRPKMIVPQHGAILQGQIMETFLDRLYDLPMGFDLQQPQEPDAELEAYTDILQKLYRCFIAASGPEEAELLFDFSRRNQELFKLVDMDIRGVQGVKREPARALELFLRQVAGFYDRNLFNELRSLAIKETVLHHLPLPMDSLYQAEIGEVLADISDSPLLS